MKGIGKRIINAVENCSDDESPEAPSPFKKDKPHLCRKGTIAGLHAVLGGY